MKQQGAKVIGIIPARYASKRFFGKMLANIFDTSLIRMTYENTLKSEALDEVVVATDHKMIFDHVRSFGGKVYMTGEEHICGTDRVAEVAIKHFPDAEIIVNVQGDEPCLDPSVITALVDMLQKEKKAQVATPVTLIENEEQFRSPSIVKCVFDKENRALYFSRSPIPYTLRYDPKLPIYRHIGVYAFKPSFLQTYCSLMKTPLQEREDLEQLRILEHGYSLYVCHVSTETIGVDIPDDLKKVENYLCQKNTSLSPEASFLL
jgi:3-deoxy-manno-octulosonate cytidylyltransferase (CMP-KDO synthetase)